MIEHPRTLHRPGRGFAIASIVALIVALGVSIDHPPRPFLLWNASPSSPVGLYRVAGARRIQTGDMVIAWAPPAARRLAAARAYLPYRVPLVKRVAAVANDRVCAVRNRILINGRNVAVRLSGDRAGRAMAGWTGCKRLPQGELFLLSANAPLAFDGRYFGVTEPGQVIGTARLIWARPSSGSSHG